MQHHNHVCFTCHLVRRARCKQTVHCPHCRQAMTWVGLARPPRRRDDAAWRAWWALLQTWRNKMIGVQIRSELYKKRRHQTLLDVIEYRDSTSKADRRKYRRASARYDDLEKHH